MGCWLPKSDLDLFFSSSNSVFWPITMQQMEEVGTFQFVEPLLHPEVVYQFVERLNFPLLNNLPTKSAASGILILANIVPKPEPNCLCVGLITSRPPD